nr:hypothetical protein CFP56_56482 [Quercus suber]
MPARRPKSCLAIGVDRLNACLLSKGYSPHNPDSRISHRRASIAASRRYRLSEERRQDLPRKDCTYCAAQISVCQLVPTSIRLSLFIKHQSVFRGECSSLSTRAASGVATAVTGRAAYFGATGARSSR